MSIPKAKSTPNVRSDKGPSSQRLREETTPFHIPVRAPTAVVVKIFVPDHVFGNVTSRSRMLFAQIPLFAPLIKIGFFGQALHVYFN